MIKTKLLRHNKSISFICIKTNFNYYAICININQFTIKVLKNY